MAWLLAVALAFALLLPGHTRLALSNIPNPKLIISEVHPNAALKGAAVESHEWIELTNREPRRLSLDGWFVEDAQAIARLPDIELDPGASALVVGKAAEVRVPASGTLIDLHGIRHDAVSWGDIRISRYLRPPQQRDSIIRTPLDHQRENERPTPWNADESFRADPAIHWHARPETRVQFVSAMIDPVDDQPETITLRNVTQQAITTINWTLTVGASSIWLRSVHIEPGESRTLLDPSGRFGSGMARSGEHLVLRDPRGNWLTTASWGNDETFHRQPAPQAGYELRFDPLSRIRPKAPGRDGWGEPLHLYVEEDGERTGSRSTFTGQTIGTRTQRERATLRQQQDADAPVIWISEVYAAAGRGRNDATYEWFELTNDGDQPLDLAGWTIADNTDADPLDGVVVPPMASVVIGVSIEAHANLIPVIADGQIGNGLANAGDQLRLIDPAGLVVSAVSWGSDRSISTVRAATATQSIHLTSPDVMPRLAAPNPGALLIIAAIPSEQAAVPTEQDQAAANRAKSDQSAIDLAQPLTDDGARAPVPTSPADQPAPVRITEILPAPLIGGAEWVELFNVSDAPIDLTGWSIADLVRRTDLFGVIPPRGRLVISSLPLDEDTPAVVVDRIGNGLHNEADTLIVYDAAEREVDRVAYGTDELPTPGSGRSIALDPARWVVTAHSSPGTDDVVPLLDDAFRSAAIRQPVSDDGRQPVVQSTEGDDGTAWMIVSFALIGVILTLVLRLWQPPQTQPAPQSPQSLRKRNDEPMNTAQPAPTSERRAPDPNEDIVNHERDRE